MLDVLSNITGNPWAIPGVMQANITQVVAYTIPQDVLYEGTAVLFFLGMAWGFACAWYYIKINKPWTGMVIKPKEEDDNGKDE